MLCIVVCYRVLQCVAVRCSVLQCVAVRGTDSPVGAGSGVYVFGGFLQSRVDK